MRVAAIKIKEKNIYDKQTLYTTYLPTKLISFLSWKVNANVLIK